MDETTRRQLDKVVACTLRDAGISQPPVNVQDILDFQKLHRDFFDLEDPSVLRRFWHRVKVEGHLLVKIVKKIKLSAVWLPDEDRIIVAQDLPKPKQEWASFHDLVHCLCEWHRPFFLGDTAQTLEPEYQLLLEEEANYGASGLMFCGARFQSEARDVSLDWSGVDILCKRYGKSITTTLRRFVQWGHDHPMVMLVSTPSWKEAPEGQTERWRHFVVSPSFASRFDETTPADLLLLVDAYAIRRRGGPVGEFTARLTDNNGTPHEFNGQSFYNRHDILTLFVLQKPLTATRIVVPRVVVA